MTQDQNGVRTGAKAALLGIGLLGTGSLLAAELTVPTTHELARVQMKRAGVSVELVLERPAKDGTADRESLVNARFTVSDTASGRALTGLKTRAWMSKSGSEVLDDAQCRYLTKGLLSGELSKRAEVDMNNFRVAVLNQDRTISIIDPRVEFKQSQQEALITLPGIGGDWVLVGGRLFVTLPAERKLAMVDTNAGNRVELISLDEGGGKPFQIVADPAGRRIWVGMDGAADVVSMDACQPENRQRVAVGDGSHAFAFSNDGRYVLVSNSVANSVSLLDAQQPKKLDDIALGETPLPVAYSRAGGRFYAASLNSDVISVIDPESRRVTATIPVGQGVVALDFEPNGRFGFALVQPESAVKVFDAATHHVIGTAKVDADPDQISFSRDYAYIHSAGSEKIVLINLAQLEKGHVTAASFAAGQRGHSTGEKTAAATNLMVPGPSGDALFVANAADANLYYYMEGMMAPIGTLSNDHRNPLGVLLLDRSLRESKPGVYATTFKAPPAGEFNVPIVIDTPPINGCVRVSLAAGGQASAEAGIDVEPLFGSGQFARSRRVRLRFRVTDRLTAAPLDHLRDFQVLLFEAPGNWQRRLVARNTGDGIYEVALVFTRASEYLVMLQLPSRHLRYQDLPRQRVRVVDSRTSGADSVNRSVVGVTETSPARPTR